MQARVVRSDDASLIFTYPLSDWPSYPPPLPLSQIGSAHGRWRFLTGQTVVLHKHVSNRRDPGFKKSRCRGFCVKQGEGEEGLRVQQIDPQLSSFVNNWLPFEL